MSAIPLEFGWFEAAVGIAASGFGISWFQVRAARAAAADTRQRVTALAAPMPREASDLESAVRTSLDRTAAVMRSPSVVLVMDEPDEPWVIESFLSEDGFRLTRHPPEESAVPAFTELDEEFVMHDATEPHARAWRVVNGKYIAAKDLPVSRAFAAARGFRRTLGYSLRGDFVRGWLLIADHGASPDHQWLGGIAAERVCESIEAHFAAQQHRRIAAATERRRISREIHDGVLQALTGAALTLRSATDLLETDPTAARTQLESIGDLLREEQRALRLYIEGQMSADDGDNGRPADPGARIADMAQRISALWGIRVAVDLTDAVPLLSVGLANQLGRLMREAVVNAAGHGRASTAHVRILANDRSARLQITDDGRGFGFRGRYEMGALQDAKLGPVVLKQQVVALGGSMTIDSRDTGSTIEIDIPAPARTPIAGEQDR